MNKPQTTQKFPPPECKPALMTFSEWRFEEERLGTHGVSPFWLKRLPTSKQSFIASPAPAMAHAPWRTLQGVEPPVFWQRGLERARTAPEDELARVRVILGAEPGACVVPVLAVEIPDFPIFREWMQWLNTQGSSGQVAVTMTAQQQWANRREELRGSLRSLIQTGRPEAHWLMIWHPEQ